MNPENKRKEELKKEILGLGRRRDLITGIHNYCDRWCERCPFTTQCGSYALEDSLWDDEEKKTSQNGEMGMEGTVDEGKRREMGKKC